MVYVLSMRCGEDGYGESIDGGGGSIIPSAHGSVCIRIALAHPNLILKVNSANAVRNIVAASAATAATAACTLYIAHVGLITRFTMTFLITLIYHYVKYWYIAGERE